MTALDRTSWVFYNMATNSSIVITVIYWTAIYDPGIVTQLYCKK